MITSYKTLIVRFNSPIAVIDEVFNDVAYLGVGNLKEWIDDDGILIAKNLGPRLGIDESEFGHEVYTILHNKDAHGKKGAIVAIVKGTDPETVAKALRKMPQKDREAVGLVSMDLSDSMRSIVRMAFPNAMVVRDCFHVMKRGGEGIEELRMKYKREAVKDVNRQKAQGREHEEGTPGD